MSSETEHPGDLDSLQSVDFLSSFSPLHRQTAGTMEQMANAVVNHTYRTLRNRQTGKNQCSLVRLFRSCAVGQLPEDLQEKVPKVASKDDDALVLLASRGQAERWNSRETSRGHQVFLIDPDEIGTQAPMIATMLDTMGARLGVNEVDHCSISNGMVRPLNLFYVEDAMRSDLIPEKEEFVIPYGIKSVVSLGGHFSSRHIFTMVIFFNVNVPEDVAMRFRGMAQTVYELLKPYENEGRIFSDM